jgi:hypothetical protein
MILLLSNPKYGAHGTGEIDIALRKMACPKCVDDLKTQSTFLLIIVPPNIEV